jgi:hypothetical protein
MILERNGIVIFSSVKGYEDHPAVRALKGVSLGDVRFPFGFFLVENNGKKVVLPATEEDRRKRLLTAFPDIPPEVMGGKDCMYHHEDECGPGTCSGPYDCMRITEPTSNYYGCGCFPIW